MEDTQRPTPGAPYGPGFEHTPIFDDLHRAIQIDRDHAGTMRLRMVVVGLERMLGNIPCEVRREAIGAIVVVLARAYVGGARHKATPIPPV